MTWHSNRLALQCHLEHDSLDDFLAWSTIRATMYVGNVGYVTKEFEELEPELTIATRLSGFGSDTFGDNDPNLIHQAYHLKQWLDRTKQNLSEMTNIIEFGAGYGAMALILHRLDYRGYYYIIDLPELIQIQK